jgi:predicted RNase H-like nuclease
MDAGRPSIQKVAKLSDFFDSAVDFEVIAIDVPIGLLDAYEVGGRDCDRAARKLLGKPRGSSVFPAPVRCVLAVLSGSPGPVAKKHKEACDRSRASAPHGKGITRQTFNILPKIREVDDLLRTRPELRDVVREIHPEVCFYQLAGGKPMTHRKSLRSGKDERRGALSRVFPELNLIEKIGREQGLKIEDILDATVACWSASRLAVGEARRVPESPACDSTGLPMAIWS